MRLTGLAVFDNTIHATNAWLKELMDQMRWEDRQRAYHALRTGLHALQNQLTVEGAVALGAQLPMLTRGFYYESWHLGTKPLQGAQQSSIPGSHRGGFSCRGQR